MLYILCHLGVSSFCNNVMSVRQMLLNTASYVFWVWAQFNLSSQLKDIFGLSYPSVILGSTACSEKYLKTHLVYYG
jgi:hypothetical protein